MKHSKKLMRSKRDHPLCFSGRYKNGVRIKIGKTVCAVILPAPENVLRFSLGKRERDTDIDKVNEEKKVDERAPEHELLIPIQTGFEIRFFGIVKSSNAIEKSCDSESEEYAEKPPVAVVDVRHHKHQERGEQITLMHIVTKHKDRKKRERAGKIDGTFVLGPCKEVKQQARCNGEAHADITEDAVGVQMTGGIGDRFPVQSKQREGIVSIDACVLIGCCCAEILIDQDLIPRVFRG